MTHFLPVGQVQILRLNWRMDARAGLEATILKEGEVVTSLDVKILNNCTPVTRFLRIRGQL